MHKQIKQNPQTIKLNPKKPTNKSNKTHIPFEFRFSRKRELERLKRKIRVERTNLKLPCQVKGGRRVCELRLGRETHRAQRNSMRESERFLNSWVFEGISNPWIWTPQIQDGFWPNPNPILLGCVWMATFEFGFGFGFEIH